MKVVKEKKDQLQKQVCRHRQSRARDCQWQAESSYERCIALFKLVCMLDTGQSSSDGRIMAEVQIEFYFSNSNLPFDKFLKEQCSAEGGCAFLSLISTAGAAGLPVRLGVSCVPISCLVCSCRGGPVSCGGFLKSAASLGGTQLSMSSCKTSCTMPHALSSAQLVM
jgi:hypothetical protein